MHPQRPRGLSRQFTAPMHGVNRYFFVLTCLVSGLCFVLAGVWLLDPGLLAGSWGVDETLGMEVVGRRIGVLMAGFGVLSWAFRNVEPSPARTALEWSLTLTFLGIATLGFWQFATHAVTVGILPAGLLELIVAAAFLNLIRLERRHTKENP